MRGCAIVGNGGRGTEQGTPRERREAVAGPQGDAGGAARSASFSASSSIPPLLRRSPRAHR